MRDHKEPTSTLATIRRNPRTPSAYQRPEECLGLYHVEWSRPRVAPACSSQTRHESSLHSVSNLIQATYTFRTATKKTQSTNLKRLKMPSIFTHRPSQCLIPVSCIAILRSRNMRLWMHVSIRQTATSLRFVLGQVRPKRSLSVWTGILSQLLVCIIPRSHPRL